METGILESKDKFQYGSLHLDKKTTRHESVEYTLAIQSRFSTFIYTYNATMHWNNRILGLWLLLKDHVVLY